MEKNNLKVGDPVMVLDQGLLMLQRFAPPAAKPNNHGTVAEICDDGTIVVEFPLDGENHSQVAPYPASIVKKRISYPNPDNQVK